MEIDNFKLKILSLSHTLIRNLDLHIQFLCLTGIKLGLQMGIVHLIFRVGVTNGGFKGSIINPK